MIVSASYNDDIPAFYGRWFMKRLDAGFCRTFDSQGLQRHRVPLTRDAVDGFVFWTRDAAPFLSALDDIRRRGFPFVVQYGLTGEAANAVGMMHALADAHGPRTVVWRYEPIVVSAEKTLDWHVAEFERLAAPLEGATDEAVVAFVRGDADIPRGANVMRSAIKRLAAVSAARGMRLTLCSEPDYLVPGTTPARCIDATRLWDISDRPVIAETHPRWPGCLCAAARDIGAPPAVAPRGAAMAPIRADHDEDGEFLAPPPAPFAAASGADLPF